MSQPSPPGGAGEVGAVLRRARERAGLPIVEAAQASGLDASMVKTLETAELAAWAADSRLVAALRIYARRLGLDPEPLVAAASDAAAEQQRPEAEPAVEPLRPTPEYAHGHRSPRRAVLAGAAAVAVLLAAGGVVALGGGSAPEPWRPVADGDADARSEASDVEGSQPAAPASGPRADDGSSKSGGSAQAEPRGIETGPEADPEAVTPGQSLEAPLTPPPPPGETEEPIDAGAGPQTATNGATSAFGGSQRPEGAQSGAPAAGSGDAGANGTVADGSGTSGSPASDPAASDPPPSSAPQEGSGDGTAGGGGGAEPPEDSGTGGSGDGDSGGDAGESEDSGGGEESDDASDEDGGQDGTDDDSGSDEAGDDAEDGSDLPGLPEPDPPEVEDVTDTVPDVVP